MNKVMKSIYMMHFDFLSYKYPISKRFMGIKDENNLSPSSDKELFKFLKKYKLDKSK